MRDSHHAGIRMVPAAGAIMPAACRKAPGREGTATKQRQKNPRR